jgi:ABC-type multidrug transport system ATPase subunit
VDIVFQNIEYSVLVEKNRNDFALSCKKEYEVKQILRGISGIAKASEITAIMGASGAGKTTLLNILSCRVPFQNESEVNEKIAGVASGMIWANNTHYKYQTFGDFSNYVMQTDVLLQSLTVRETLEYVAALKLSAPVEERKQRVATLVANLKLEKCIDTLVGGSLLKGISGGERKRTSIAFELVSNPSVLILDEPTSGLDSLTAYIICSYLNRLCQNENKTVIMTIHQPNSEIFCLLDKLILMV